MKELPSKPSEMRGASSSLSPRDLLRLPGKKAIDMILDSPTPAHLVQSFPEEDLFWLVQDIGPEDALPILSFASNEQWQYLLDIELWDKDRLELGSVNRWLDLLLKADPERLLIWGLREHIELVELHLSKNIDVRIKQQDESTSDFDESYFTLDGVFYIRIRHEEYDQTIREFLGRLAAHDVNRYHHVLIELAGVLPAEVEENIYRLRNVRLAEKGFLPFEEAIGIYQHLSPKSLLKEKKDTQKIVREAHLLESTPVSTSLLIQDQDLFYLCLQHIEESQTLQRLQIEFAAMCNQIISADGFVVRDKEGLAAVVRKACGYLDIGLERLDGKDPAKGARLLKTYLLDQIFRVGYGTGLELKWRMEKWLKNSWFVTRDFGLEFWGDQWEGIMEGLVRKRPQFFTGFSEQEPYREFKDLAEITHCHRALDDIMAVDHLLSLVMANTSVADPMGYQPVRWMNLILTCWARHHLSLSEEMEPLPAGQLEAFFQDLWTGREKPCRVEEKMKQSFWDWLTARSGLAPDELKNAVGPIIDSLFDELENEYGSVSIEDLDPRYVRHLLVTWW